jgi:hypothetical protein
MQRAVTPDIASGFEASGVEGLVGRTLLEVERKLILKTLEHCEGNRTRGARARHIVAQSAQQVARLCGGRHKRACSPSLAKPCA